MRKKIPQPAPTPSTEQPITPAQIVSLILLTRVLKSLGILGLLLYLGCGAADGLFPTRSAAACGTQTECVDDGYFGTTANLWCSYNGNLKKQQRGPACLRVPCSQIGQICSTGGICEPPDDRAKQDGLIGSCRKFVCSKSTDCLIPTPVCANGFCVPEQILMFP